MCATLKPRDDERVDSFEEYLNSTWFSEKSRFEIHVWSHCKNFGPRTNNNLEGFHSKINRLLKRAHPNFFHVLDVIRNIQRENEIDFDIFQATGKQRPPLAKYLRVHNRLMELRGKLTEGNIRLYKFMEECVRAIKVFE